jgi:hypothetical protein
MPLAPLNAQTVTSSSATSSQLESETLARVEADAAPFASGPNWPTSGNLYGQGDSQTYGTNAAVAGGRLPEAERWPNVLATTDGRNLTVTNLGRPGEKISAQGGGTTQNIWNSFGSIPWDWTGVGASMLGYNNSSTETTTPAYYGNMESAFEAFLARWLVDDYAGLGTSGWGHTGSAGGTLHGFVTTGSSGDAGVTAGESAARNPFYYGDANGALKRVHLASGQYVEFTLADCRAAGLFLYSRPGGGGYTVTVNGQVWKTGTTAYTGVGGNDPADHWYPRVAWLEGLPASAVIRLTATSSTVTWLAYGWVPLTGARTDSKTILLAGPTGNQANGRGDRMLTELNYRAQAAVAKFRSYPVYYADPWTAWERGKFDEPSDISHFNGLGAAHVAKAFGRAGRLGRSIVLDQPVTMRRVAEYLDNFQAVELAPTLWHSTVTNGGLLTGSGTLNAFIAARCSNTASSTVLGRHNGTGTMKTLIRPSDRHAERDTAFIDWSLPFRVSFTMSCESQTANGSGYLYFGRPYNNTTISALSAKGLGIKLENNLLKGQVHDGTTLTTSSTLYTIATNKLIAVAIESDGNGTVRYYVNGSKVWTTTAGPTGSGGALSTSIEIAGDNGGAAAYYIWSIYRLNIAHLPIWERNP